ncbi:MAG: hypothetical protein ACRCY3_08800 [Sphingorhabdus sp.]
MTTIAITDFTDLPDQAEQDRRASKIFVHVALIGCLIFQRFCVFVGGSPIYFCLPIFLGLLGWLWFTQRAEVRPLSLGLYLCFAIVGLASTFVALNNPDVRLSGISIGSLLSVLSIYIGLTMQPTKRFDGTVIFDVLIIYLRVIAICGIVQYLIQFAGIRVFAFMTVFPALKPFLIEPFFNYHPVVHYGSDILRSNGFFLLEPSTFSQILVLGFLVDFFIRRDWRFIPVYSVAYLTTYAGTGLLAFTIAAIIALFIAPREAPRLVIFAIVGAIVMVIAGLLFPAQFAGIAGRANELTATGSSGYARYVSQFGALEAIWGETRTLIGYGPGALERAVFYPQGSGNPAFKLFVDYGFLGLIVFMVFFVVTLWRGWLALITLFLLVNFQLGGGNLLFPPLIVLAAIVCIWSKPKEVSE